MGLNSVSLVVCPRCKIRPVLQHQQNSLVCPKCNQRFQVVDGIVDAFVPIEGLRLSAIDLAKAYDSWGEFVTRPAEDNLRRDRTVDLVEGGLLLEIGCAEGFMTERLAQRVSHVVGSDIALSYLRRAKARVPHASFARLDIHNIPFEDETFDCVVCTEVLEHAMSPIRALDEMHRILKSAGVLVLSVPNSMTPARIMGHLLKRKDSLVGLQGAHINFYDTGSILQTLQVAGFEPQVITTDRVDMPLPLPMLGRLLKKQCPYLGHVVILKASKSHPDYWDRLDAQLRSPKAAD